MQERSTRNAGAAAACSLAVAGVLGIDGAIAGLLSATLVALGMPLFRSYAMARPNARSSHSTPVPQGGGAAVVVAALAIAALHVAKSGEWSPSTARFIYIAAGALLLAVIGALDDIRNLPVLPRLTGQMAAVALVVFGARHFGQILPLPYGVEALLLVLAGTWFVNLTNFMDGIDGITLAAFMPLTAGAALLASMGYMTPTGGILAICFFGALAGFVFFNWHPASLFLGDVGSLPVGLLGGALLLDLAQNGAMAAAIILPLYHFVDATLTLLLRLSRREKVWEAHRQHAYQQAVDGGLSTPEVSGLVLMLNTVLVGFAILSVGKNWGVQAMLVALSLAGVIGLIGFFRRRPHTS